MKINIKALKDCLNITKEVRITTDIDKHTVSGTLYAVDYHQDRHLVSEIGLSDEPVNMVIGKDLLPILKVFETCGDEDINAEVYESVIEFKTDNAQADYLSYKFHGYTPAYSRPDKTFKVNVMDIKHLAGIIKVMKYGNTVIKLREQGSRMLVGTGRLIIEQGIYVKDPIETEFGLNAEGVKAMGKLAETSENLWLGIAPEDVYITNGVTSIKLHKPFSRYSMFTTVQNNFTKTDGAYIRVDELTEEVLGLRFDMTELKKLLKLSDVKTVKFEVDKENNFGRVKYNDTTIYLGGKI